MSSHHSSPSHEHRVIRGNVEPDANANEVSTEQLRRLAMFIANGEASLPLDLNGVQLRFVLMIVNDFRRRRLTEFIAQQIALALVRKLNPD